MVGNAHSTRGISIGFTRNSTHPQNISAYETILSQENIRVFGVCIDKGEKKEYEKHTTVYCFEEWIKKNWHKIDINNFYKYQQKYSDYNLWEIFYQCH